MRGQVRWWRRGVAMVVALAAVAMTPTRAGAEEPAEGYDLSLTVAFPDHIEVGVPAVLEVTVHNAGPSTAAEPTVSSGWQAHELRFRGATGGGADCWDPAYNAHCVLDPLAAGASVTVDVTVEALRPGALAGDIGMVIAAGETDNSNNGRTFVLDATGDVQTADVSVTVDPATQAGAVNAESQVVLHVRNDGPHPARRSVVTASWGPGATTDDAVTPPASATFCQVWMAELTCLVDVPAGATVDIPLAMTPQAVGELGIAAEVDYYDDLHDADDRATGTVEVAGADVGIAIDAAAWVPEGVPTGVTLRGWNSGPAAAGDVTMSLTWPEQATITIDDAGGMPCAIEGGELSCDVGDVAAGWSGEVVLSLVSDEAHELDLIGNISSPHDVDLADNEAHASLAVPAAPDTYPHTFDLSIVDIELPESFQVGEIAVIDVTIYNAGQATAPLAKLGPTWDRRRVRFIGGGGAAVECGTPTYSGCITGPIPAGETAVVRMVAEPLRPGPVDGGFFLAFTSNESRTYNNGRGAPFVVDGEVLTADTWVTATPEEGPGAIGETVERTITVGNDGPHPAKAIDLEIAWWGNTVDVSLPTLDATQCHRQGDFRMLCRLPEIPAGSELVIPATFTPHDDDKLWVQLEIDYIDETNPANDTASTLIDIPVTQDPDGPVVTHAVAGDRWIEVGWDAPVNDGGAPITEYVAIANPGAHTCTVAGHHQSCIIEGLANGTSYEVVVKAANWRGWGPPGPAVTVVPRTVPGAPRQVEAVARDGAAQVRWEAPRRDGGAPITAYRVATVQEVFRCRTDGALRCRVGGLTNGRSYVFTVQARNEAGWGRVSALSAEVTPRAPRHP